MNIFETWIATKPIAHRGLHNENVPENSIAAFEAAIAANYAIELDVRALRDGTIIVFHDESLGRMTGKDGYLANLSYEDIKDIRLAHSREKIPTLNEVLECVAGRTPILIEIKNMGKVGDVEKAVYKVLKNYKGEFAIESFNPYSLEWFKINAPHVKRGQISSFMKNNSEIGFWKRFMLKRMMFNKKVSEPNFISYQCENLPNRFVKKYKHLPLIAWCVRTDEELERVKKISDNIIFENISPAV